VSSISQATRQRFPFTYENVFDGLRQVLPQLGLKVKEADGLIGRITASTGMSLLSWGENLTLVVERIDDGSSLVMIESALKVGVDGGGGHRHQRNFNKIISALSQHLQRTAVQA
jgi:hypothetical protein